MGYGSAGDWLYQLGLAFYRPDNSAKLLLASGLPNLFGGRAAPRVFSCQVLFFFSLLLYLIVSTRFGTRQKEGSACPIRKFQPEKSSIGKSNFGSRNIAQDRSSSSPRPSSITNSIWPGLSNSGSNFDFEAARKEQQRKSDELRRKLHSDSNQVRQQLQNNR